MARTTFQGPVRSLGGFYQQGPATTVGVTASVTLSPDSYAGRFITVGGTLASDIVLTLPAINTSANPTTSGPGQDPSTANNEGVTYTIWVPTTIATSSLKITVTSGSSDVFVGSLMSVDTDTSGAMVGFTSSSNTFINLNGTTTGGVAGSWIQIVAIASDKYMVTGVILGSSTVATPFANS
jgi:hypothetical protein